MGLFAIAALLLGGVPARAAIELRTVATGLSAPVYVTHAGDGSGRLFIVEQGGLIRILSLDTVLNTPFLDLSDRVHTELEAGLLGMAFHPNYSINGRFFVNYVTEGSNGLETIIAEYAVSLEDANVADTGSEEILLRFPQDTAEHNGGMLAFGPDGFLYIATGDGGAFQDLMFRAQNLETLLGKILRIDIDSGAPYGVPPDNPFVDMPGRDEIWAYGLRNPWRFSIDPVTGRLIVGDVGRTRREEVDIIEPGGNYGWNTMEGTLCFQPENNCNTEGLIPPVHEYDHDTGCAITGGYVYRGSEIPSLWGKYVFGDFCTGQIWTLREISPGQWQREPLLQVAFVLSSFGEDESGELYVVDYQYLANPPIGTVRKIVSTDAPRSAVNEGGVVNAASFLPGPVAPGQIVSIFGSAMGPEEGVGARLASSGRVDTFVADTKVLFDGIPSPLFFVREDQINAQVPYAVAGLSSTQMQVQFADILTEPVTLPVAEAAPGIFTASGGTGQGAILNQDESYNSSSNPAARGSTVVLYATGEGQTAPAVIEGQLSEFPFPTPLLPVSVTIGGLPAEVLFAGLAPGFTGLMQVNVRIPGGVAPGPVVPVVLTIGAASSQAGVTLAVN